MPFWRTVLVSSISYVVSHGPVIVASRTSAVATFQSDGEGWRSPEVSNTVKIPRMTLTRDLVYLVVLTSDFRSIASLYLLCFAVFPQHGLHKYPSAVALADAESPRLTLGLSLVRSS